jgi:NTP pyrophosphatase (non-canonical NTP hydrolase)
MDEHKHDWADDGKCAICGYKPHYCYDDVGEMLSHFSDAMEAKMMRRQYHGHWKHCSLQFLFTRLVEEMRELCQEISPDAGQPFSLEKVVDESTDVANVAMMIWDVANRRCQVKGPVAESFDPILQTIKELVNERNQLRAEVAAMSESISLDPDSKEMWELRQLRAMEYRQVANMAREICNQSIQSGGKVIDLTPLMDALKEVGLWESTK